MKKQNDRLGATATRTVLWRREGGRREGGGRKKSLEGTGKKHLAVVEHFGVDPGAAKAGKRASKQPSRHYTKLVLECFQDAIVANLRRGGFRSV